MSFFGWSMEISFFGMPLAGTWLARTQYHAKDAILVTNDKRYYQRRASRSRPGLGTGRPYICLICAPKIGMNRTGIVLSSSGCNSSRFSGPCTPSYVKGIPKKDIPMFLICIASPQKDITKKDISVLHIQFLRRKNEKEQ